MWCASLSLMYLVVSNAFMCYLSAVPHNEPSSRTVTSLGHELQLLSASVNFTSAAQLCGAQDAFASSLWAPHQLAYIASAHEWDELAFQLQRLSFSEVSRLHAQHTWLGLNRWAADTATGAYTDLAWASGRVGGYVRWAAGEPAGGAGSSALGLCVALDLASGSAVVRPCSANATALCRSKWLPLPPRLSAMLASCCQAPCMPGIRTLIHFNIICTHRDVLSLLRDQNMRDVYMQGTRLRPTTRWSSTLIATASTRRRLSATTLR